MRTKNPLFQQQQKNGNHFHWKRELFVDMWQRRFHFPLATFTSFLLVARAQQHRPRYVPGFVSFIQSSTPEVNFPVSNPQNVCSVAFFVVVVVVFCWNSHSVSILTKKKTAKRQSRGGKLDSVAGCFFFITGSVATFLFSSPPNPTVLQRRRRLYLVRPHRLECFSFIFFLKKL